jgi:crotonobetainyl-CoA:carnitine CoA-transferase CaiB-like acyl-CoA transferase
MQAVKREDLADDPRLANNSGRVKHETEIDDVLANWCSSLPAETVLNVLEEYRVPAGPIYNVEDMLSDPHFNQRGLFESVEINGKPLKLPAIMPKLEQTPGSTDWPGGNVGEYNQEVFEELLQLDGDELAELKEQGVIS